jgi:hypothetical protein
MKLDVLPAMSDMICSPLVRVHVSGGHASYTRKSLNSDIDGDLDGEVHSNPDGNPDGNLDGNRESASTRNKRLFL